MERLEAALPSGRTLRAIDVALAAWALAWIVVAILVANCRDLAAGRFDRLARAELQRLGLRP